MNNNNISHCFTYKVSYSPVFFLLLGLSYSMRHNNTEIRPINNPTMTSTRSSERKSGKSLTLNQARNTILWPPDGTSQLIGKDPDAGKDWRQEEDKMAEDEMVGWHHQLNGREFEQSLGDSEGQGSLACCSPWGCKESDRTEQLDNNWFINCNKCILLM